MVRGDVLSSMGCRERYRWDFVSRLDVSGESRPRFGDPGETSSDGTKGVRSRSEGPARWTSMKQMESVLYEHAYIYLSIWPTSIESQLIVFARTLLVLIKASRVSRYTPIASAGPARENRSDIFKKSIFVTENNNWDIYSSIEFINNK